MIRLMIVDDHPLFRDGLAGLLATDPDIEVVAAVGDGETAVRLATELAPDVMVMDLNMPGLPGLEAIRRIRRLEPAPAVLVLTMTAANESVTAAMQVGAQGYLLKGAMQEDVLAALRTVATGGVVYGAGTTHRGPGSAGLADLTGREAEVLALLADGRSNVAIARELGVSLKTVQNHVSRVLTKLRVADRTQAALRMRGIS